MQAKPFRCTGSTELKLTLCSNPHPFSQRQMQCSVAIEYQNPWQPPKSFLPTSSMICSDIAQYVWFARTQALLLTPFFFLFANFYSYRVLFFLVGQKSRGDVLLNPRDCCRYERSRVALSESAVTGVFVVLTSYAISIRLKTRFRFSMLHKPQR